MNNTAIIRTPRFAQPLNLTTHLSQEITRPFFETEFHPATHDMLLLNTHPDLLPEPEPAPIHELTFFNIDRP